MLHNNNFLKTFIIISLLVLFFLNCNKINSTNIKFKYKLHCSSYDLNNNRQNNNYFDNLEKLIINNWIPPDEFIINNDSKYQYLNAYEVKVVLVINRNGDVLNIKLFDSGGNKEIDNSCFKAIYKSNNFGKIPYYMKDNYFPIPIIFSYEYKSIGQ